MSRLALALFLFGVRPVLAPAQSPLPAPLQDVRFDQRLGASLPLELAFRDEEGRAVQLGDYFGKRPVILVLAYYRCPMLCTLVLNGLTRTMLELPFTAGREFEVVTVSFDSRETPELATAKKRSYIERYGRPGASEGWHFLTGQAKEIETLCDAGGFRFRYDARLDQFAHASGIMLTTPEGKLARYFYGIAFPARDVRLGLVEASANRIGTPVDQVLLYCFHYDPETGRYGPVVMNIVRLGGAATILTLGSFLGLAWRRERNGGITTRIWKRARSTRKG